MDCDNAAAGALESDELYQQIEGMPEQHDGTGNVCVEDEEEEVEYEEVTEEEIEGEEGEQETEEEDEEEDEEEEGGEEEEVEVETKEADSKSPGTGRGSDRQGLTAAEPSAASTAPEQGLTETQGAAEEAVPTTDSGAGGASSSAPDYTQARRIHGLAARNVWEGPNTVMPV